MKSTVISVFSQSIELFIIMAIKLYTIIKLMSSRDGLLINARALIGQSSMVHQLNAICDRLNH